MRLGIPDVIVCQYLVLQNYQMKADEMKRNSIKFRFESPIMCGNNLVSESVPSQTLNAQLLAWPRVVVLCLQRLNLLAYFT